MRGEASACLPTVGRRGGWRGMDAGYNFLSPGVRETQPQKLGGFCENEKKIVVSAVDIEHGTDTVADNGTGGGQE